MTRTHRSKRLLLLLAIVPIACLAVACKPKVKASHFPLNPLPSQPVMYTIEAGGVVDKIEVKVNGAVFNTCFDTSTCSYTGGPYPNSNQGWVSYGGKATDGADSTEVGPYSFAVGQPWNGLGFIPVRHTGKANGDAIDICFAMDLDYMGNIPLFQTHVADKIFERYFETPKIRPHADKYNFYYRPQPTIAVNCGSFDEVMKLQGAHCDAIAVLHQSNFTDCTTGKTFSAEGTETKAFIHESGHAVYGLSDEYEGNTSYHMASPHPNIWMDVAPGPSSTGDLMCQLAIGALGGDVSKCNEFCSSPLFCTFGWWRHGTGTTVMSNGFFDEAWGLQGIRRLKWFHNKY